MPQENGFPYCAVRGFPYHERMMQRYWKLFFGLGLTALSAVLYALHFMLFHDSHHIFLYLVGDIAFIPLEVLLVTLILHQVLEKREHHAKLQKLNMAIGLFYGEMGTDLLCQLRSIEQSAQMEEVCLGVRGTWTKKEFQNARAQSAKLTGLQFSTQAPRLEALNTFLHGKRDFLLRLLENPNLLEHEAFTDLLWAVFHLTDELAHRQSFADLPETDRKHLNGDMERVFTHLLAAWIAYMQHLKTDYPYLFSLAVRTNPFDPTADVLIRS